MRLTHISSILTVGVFLAACTHDTTSPHSQLSGQVQAITPPSLNVGGKIVLTTAATTIMRGSTRIDLISLHVGEPVRVEMNEESGDTVDADEIDADENEVEIHGTIDSIVAPKLWVQGRTVVTDSDTHISRGDDQPDSLAGLKAGDTVTVEGTLQPDSSVLAHRIRVGSEDDEDGDEGAGEAELRGPIDSIVGLDFFVGGHTVVTDTATIITRDDSLVKFADLTVGDTVAVEGELQADNSVLARKVEIKSGDSEGEHPDSTGDHVMLTRIRAIAKP